MRPEERQALLGKATWTALALFLVYVLGTKLSLGVARVEGLRLRRAALEREAALTSADLGVARSNAVLEESVARELDRRAAQVPGPRDVPRLLAALHELARATSADLCDVTLTEKTPDRAPPGGLALTELVVTLRVKADYAPLRGFLEGLERAPGGFEFSVRRAELTRGSTPVVAATVDASLWFRPATGPGKGA